MEYKRKYYSVNMMETRDVREQKRNMVGPILGLDEFDGN
jgi:hypothetical protein